MEGWRPGFMFKKPGSRKALLNSLALLSLP